MERNVFVKPDEQRQTCLSFAMARKGGMKSNVFVKPYEQRQSLLLLCHGEGKVRKATFLFTLCLLCSFGCVAQVQTKAYHPFIEDGKEWIIGYERVFDTSPFLYEKCFFAGDTIIEGTTCKKWMRQEGVDEGATQYLGALYEEDRKVWLFPAGKVEAQLYYDFGAQEGAHFTINGDTEVMVTDVRNIEYNGREMHCISISSDNASMSQPTWTENIWIEGVGGSSSPMCNSPEYAPGLRTEIVSCKVNGEVIYEGRDNPSLRLADMRADENYRSFLEAGKTWVVGTWCSGRFSRRLTYTLQRDSLFEGQTYRCMSCTVQEEGERVSEESQVALLREEGRKIWAILAGTDVPRLLYDFSGWSGDTLQIGFGTGMPDNTDPVKVTFMYNSLSTPYHLKSYTIQQIGAKEPVNYWYAGVGSEYGPLKNVDFTTDTDSDILISCQVGQDTLYYDAFNAGRLAEHIETNIPSIDCLHAPTIPHLYDLSGRCLTTPPAHGIYIENGKKRVK